MPVGFGFSIGDVIAVGELARKIVRALDESRGATADFKSLSNLLLSLNNALQAVSGTFLGFASNRNSSSLVLDSASFNGIHHELECCKRLIEEFLLTSRKYTESLLGRERWWFKDVWRKITWVLNPQDVQNLQRRLQGHLNTLQLYATTII